VHYVNARSLPSTPDPNHGPESFCFSTKPQIAVEKVKLLLYISELPGLSLDTEGNYPDCVFLWISVISPDIYRHWNWAIISSFHSLSSLLFNNYITSQDSVLGIAIRYGLGGPGIESRWARDFPHPSRPALGSTQFPVLWVPVHFPGGKAGGAWRWSPTSSGSDVKERVDLYLRSPSGPSWPALGWTLLFYYTRLWGRPRVRVAERDSK